MTLYNSVILARVMHPHCTTNHIWHTSPIHPGLWTRGRQKDACLIYKLQQNHEELQKACISLFRNSKISGHKDTNTWLFHAIQNLKNKNNGSVFIVSLLLQNTETTTGVKKITCHSNNFLCQRSQHNNGEYSFILFSVSNAKSERYKTFQNKSSNACFFFFF